MMSRSVNDSTEATPRVESSNIAPDSEGRLLVVDDEENLRITTAAILEKDGYIVDTAASGDEAISLLNDFDYDLVLTDLHMENGDGLSVLSQIRRQSPLTISVVLTGFASVESAIAALQEGAYDYLVKPCDIDSMRHTIRRGVDHRRLMLAEQKARADLEQLNKELESRIEERTSELRTLNEDLAEANRAKDVFLATLSHELRTPLTPVVGWIKLLRNGTLDAPGVAQALDAIERNAWLQSRLIDDLLDTSRIATGKLHYEPQLVDLNLAVKGAVDTVLASAGSKKIDLVVRLSGSPITVKGEPVRLQQIVWNLISNAIKFTEPGGKVTVVSETIGDEAVVTVEDSGIGIEPTFLPHVFDRFRQADGSTSRLHGGLGLGLAIAHALTKMHGGSLQAQSEGRGHGARFILRLKIDKSAQTPIETPKESQHALVGMKVLIVEDSADTLALLKTIFLQEGAQVLTATSADEALAVLKSTPTDIIVSDIGMPDTDGFELLRRIQQMPEVASTPAIAISGYASESDRKQALDVGYRALLAKPVDVDALFELIHSFKIPVTASD